MSKPRAIVIIGDSFSNGDGVYYPNECIKRMGEQWVEHTDELLHHRAYEKCTPHVVTDEQHRQAQHQFDTWLPYHVQGNYSSKQYVESHGCWSKVLERHSGIPVVNLALPGGSTKSMTESLLVWSKKNEHFVRKHHIMVMCNYGLRTRTSVTSDIVLDPLEGYTPLLGGADPFQYSSTTLNYNPGANYDFDVDGYLVHCDLLEAYKFELCHSLLMLETICDNLDMSFCWSGPHDLHREHNQTIMDFYKQINFLELPIPVHRCTQNIHPHFADINLFTLWSCKEQIKHHNFNPYSVCSHFNLPAQNLMAQQLNTLISNNTEWFWN